MKINPEQKHRHQRDIDDQGLFRPSSHAGFSGKRVNVEESLEGVDLGVPPSPRLPWLCSWSLFRAESHETLFTQCPQLQGA